MAITFPILYAVLDAIGTATDGIYLDKLSLISEDAALLAYEFTWLLYAVIADISECCQEEEIQYSKGAYQDISSSIRNCRTVLLRICHVN